MSSAFDPGTGVVILGYRPTRNDLARVRGIPICLTGRPRLYLGLSMRLQPDRSAAYLMVLTSVMILACDEDLNDILLHYDYEREFLVAERMVDARAGWRAVVDAGRHKFQMKQLSAAVRNHPEEARATLAKVDRGR